MARYYGVIGYYFKQCETKPGVWKDIIEEKEVYGDLIKNASYTENPGQYNNSINIKNQISFIADPYAMLNFQHIRYATYLGSKWEVKTVDVEYPRLILTLGGVYNDDGC